MGFKAKKKELDDFKNAIEMYESDPEMNPMTMIQVRGPLLSFSNHANPCVILAVL